jgi:serine/threonine-protein kinase HipA
MEEQNKYIKALIELHSGLDRQGPGDNDFSQFIIEQIPELPPSPRIADLGCGAGAGALILAEKFRSRVKAVDFSREFLDQLLARARKKDLEDFIEIIECDIGKLNWCPESIDLIWSEGAAYNITFKGALQAWRPLLVLDGIAVISEMNYFSADVSKAVTQYMKKVYPDIKTESENEDLINSSGFELLGLHRLPTKAWWDNYYDPLREKISAIGSSRDSVMEAVIGEMKEEMAFFKEHAKDYGYTYYIMRAV